MAVCVAVHMGGCKDTVLTATVEAVTAGVVEVTVGLLMQGSAVVAGG